jgi:very-short-patch-repair endonuclease
MPKSAHKGRRIHQMARMLRRDQTPTEKKLWSRLRGSQMVGCNFRRQFPIGEFIADFCCRESGLVIELDGAHHAGDPAQVEADKRREAAFAQRGFRVLRFWNDDITCNLERVLEQIL